MSDDYGAPDGYRYDGGPSLDVIAARLEQRRQMLGPVFERMRKIRDAYYSEVVIPLPELDRTDDTHIPNLVATGLDQTSQRIASVMPDLFYPAVRPGKDASEERARIRRMANLSWWQFSRLPLKMRRRARFFTGYGVAPALIRPDFRKGVPCWDVRDPLGFFPSPAADPEEITPEDAIFVYERPWSWLRGHYPRQMSALRTGWQEPHDVPGNKQFEVVEFHDDECKVLAVLGSASSGGWGDNRMPYVELERLRNPIELCPVVVPSRVTLGRQAGQFDGMYGMLMLQARLMSLNVTQVEKNIFPDVFLESRQNEEARFIAGPFDGRTGKVNVVAGGIIREVQSSPNFGAVQAMDQLERAQRITGGVASEFGGESPTNVRTGRRGDAVLSALVDFPIQEAQEVFAEALQEENHRAAKVARSWFGDQPRSFYVRWPKSNGPVDYVPNRDFAESDHNIVSYSMPGTDAAGLIVGIGQRVGLGILSSQGAAELDPMIGDPERERGRVAAEAVRAAVLAGLQQQATGGTLPLSDLARIADLVENERMDLIDAVLKAQREAQERQASEGPPGEPTGPVAPGAPEAQPGLAIPGMGAEAASAPAAPPDLRQMLAGLVA